MLLQTYGVTLHGLNGYLGTGDVVNNYGLYMCQIFHLFGDPAMELYTDVPQNIVTPTISVLDNSIQVSTTDGRARISFYNKTTGSVSSFVGTEVDYPYNGSDEINICITRHNYIPYIVQVGDDIYIQNENIQGGRTYKGNNIYVGKNVTTEKPQGEVIFRSGSSTTFNGRTVILDKGTTVEIGSTLNVNE